MRLKKAERVLYERYKTVFEELKNESQRVSQRAGEYLDQNRRAESDKEGIREIYSELAKIREIGEELGRIAAELTEELGLIPEELERLAKENREQDRRNERYGGIEKGIEEGDRRVREVSGELVHGVNGVISGISDKHFDSGVERGREDGSGITKGDETGVGKDRGRSREVERGNREVERERSIAKRGRRRDSIVGGRRSSEQDKSESVDNARVYHDGYFSDNFDSAVEVAVVMQDGKMIVCDPLVAEAKGWKYENVNIDSLPEVWEERKAKGIVKTYISDPQKRKKVEEALSKAVYIEEFRAPYMISGVDTREVRPTEVRHIKYWRERGKVITYEDIRENPFPYRHSRNLEIQRIAIRRIQELKQAKEIDRKIWKEREERGRGRGLSR
jgi:hypothetical protein